VPALVDRVHQVYTLTEDYSSRACVPGSLLIIGAGEEIFWRGFIQMGFQELLGGVPAWLIAATAYTAVHLATGSWALVVAASVAGLF